MDFDMKDNSLDTTEFDIEDDDIALDDEDDEELEDLTDEELQEWLNTENPDREKLTYKHVQLLKATHEVFMQNVIDKIEHEMFTALYLMYTDGIAEGKKIRQAERQAHNSDLLNTALDSAK